MDYKNKVEYIWLDGKKTIRTKTKIIYDINNLSLNLIPNWTFDGSSTHQSTVNKSDMLLIPKKLYECPYKDLKTYIVLCETHNFNNEPDISNSRHKCANVANIFDYQKPLFGFEQEYMLYDINTTKPYMWDKMDITNPQHYCGSNGMSMFGRCIAETHLDYCLQSNINIFGINAEVTPSQWEFQIGPSNPLTACDDLIVARFILQQVAENFGCRIEYHPKPLPDYNGSGCHTNFSIDSIRNFNLSKIENICKKLEQNHLSHVMSYGNFDENKLRLTGKNETSDINTFTWGIADRNASVRIPISSPNNTYLEDRRPPANIDPYIVVCKILQTICI